MILNGATITQIILVLCAPAGLAALLSAIYMKKKIKSEAVLNHASAADALTKSAVAMVSPLNDHIANLTDQLNKAQSRIAELNDQLYFAKLEISNLRFEMANLNKSLRNEKTTENP